MINEKAPSNEELITAPVEKWTVPMRTNFTLRVEVTGIYLPDSVIMKFQKKCEDIAVSMFKGGNVKYVLE